MNTELILKSTGKEFVIMTDLIKFIRNSECVYISKDSPLVYKNGDDSITMSTDDEYLVAFDYRMGSIIKIIDISEPKDEIELDINTGIIRLYKTYEFLVRFIGGKVYKIKGKFKTNESKPILSKTKDVKDIGIDYIREVYEKIESINLIDTDVFKNDKFSLNNYKITILNDLTDNINLNNIKPIVKRFSGAIESFYNDRMSKLKEK